MSDTTPLSGTTLGEQERTTKKDVENLFDKLLPTSASEKTPAERERERRLKQADKHFASIVGLLKDLGITDSKDLEAAADVANALLEASERVTVAIDSIPDNKLVAAEPKEKKQRAPRAPRASIPAPESTSTPAPTVSQATNSVGFPGGRGPDDIEADLIEKGLIEHPVAEPGEDPGPRGAVDPNAESGF